MNSVAARTEPCESVRLRYRVQASGKTIRMPTKAIAGAAKSHLRCAFAQSENLSRPLGARPEFRAALRGEVITDMVHLRSWGVNAAGAGGQRRCRPAPAGWCTGTGGAGLGARSALLLFAVQELLEGILGRVSRSGGVGTGDAGNDRLAGDFACLAYGDDVRTVVADAVLG